MNSNFVHNPLFSRNFCNKNPRICFCLNNRFIEFTALSASLSLSLMYDDKKLTFAATKPKTKIIAKNTVLSFRSLVCRKNWEFFIHQNEAALLHILYELGNDRLLRFEQQINKNVSRLSKSNKAHFLAFLSNICPKHTQLHSVKRVSKQKREVAR